MSNDLLCLVKVVSRQFIRKKGDFRTWTKSKSSETSPEKRKKKEGKFLFADYDAFVYQIIFARPQFQVVFLLRFFPSFSLLFVSSPKGKRKAKETGQLTSPRHSFSCSQNETPFNCAFQSKTACLGT